MPLPLIPILTTAGRFALPYLQRELVKQGTKKFIKDHGKEALTAVTGGVILNRVMDEEQDPSITQSVGVGPEGLVIGGEPKETLPTPPPFITPEAEKIDTTVSTPIEDDIKTEPSITPKPDIVDTTVSTPPLDPPKKEDFILTKEKAETGALTDVEVQTAKSLKGEQPDYYSKVVKGMDEFKQPIASKEQLKNYIKNLKATEAETIYLGIDNLIDSYKGDKVDITKFKKALAKKDISSTIVANEIPKGLSISGMSGDRTHYDHPSLPGKKEDKSILLIKFDRPPGEEKYFPPGSHFNSVISADTIAHVRGQMGYDLEVYGPNDTFTKEEIEAQKKLNNTFIIDEIQSDYLQDQRKNGFVSDYKILNSDEIIDFLNKNNVKYIRDNREDTNVIIFDQKGRIDFRDVFKVDPDGASKTREIALGDKYRHIVFKNNFLHSLVPQDAMDKYQYKFASNVDLKTGFGKKSNQSLDERAKMYIKKVYKPVPNLPIVKTEKWVDLSIDAAIKKAISEGADSIGFVSGNVHTNRYEHGMGSEEQQGLNYFYDNIVKKRFEKIAKQYGVEIEEVFLKSTQFQKLGEQYQYAETTENAVLTKLTAKEFLNKLNYYTENDVELPDYFNMVVGVPDETQAPTQEEAEMSGALKGKFLNQREITEQLAMQAGIIRTLDKDTAEKGTYGPESEYLVWTINNGKDIYLNLPAIQVKLSNYAKTGPLGFADDGLRDVAIKGLVVNNESSKYINDYDAVLINEEIQDTELNETIYKMPLPKELQKEILSKPKKMSKLQGQSNRLFA
tara:strand:- start:133 stop:2499 length:2367 start_codon:yes stop_codon:yes gene_type:complete